MIDDHKNPIYICPKDNKTGYQINELPFYLQNTTAVLVSQMVVNANDDQNVLFYKTYNTTYKNNKRTSITTANVDLAQKMVGINRQEILTGNYQNLLNGFYQNKTIDSTVNQRYYHTLKALNPIGNLYSSQIMQQDTLLHIQQQNALANAITQLTDTTYQINLSQWVQHITTKLTNNTKRTQPYYPDFANTDTHQITLQFDHNIQLISPQKKLLSVDEQSKIGAYYLKIEQPTPNTIQLTTALVIKADVVLPNQMSYLQQLFEAANAASNLNIQVALTQVSFVVPNKK